MLRACILPPSAPGCSLPPPSPRHLAPLSLPQPLSLPPPPSRPLSTHTATTTAAANPTQPLLQAPRLKSLWLEGNPLSPATVAALLAVLPASGLAALGLDEAQLAQLPPADRHALADAAGSKLRVAGCVPGGPGAGYFKLERAPAAAANAGNGSSRPTTEVLVVSFGSAPGGACTRAGTQHAEGQLAVAGRVQLTWLGAGGGV